MRKSVKKLIAALFLVFVISLVFIFRINKLPRSVIAIVHSNQYIEDVEHALFANNCELINVDTSKNSLEAMLEMIDQSDGVVIAGGNDFDPSIYGGDESLVEDFSRGDDDKTIEILRHTIESEKPVLGICRGMQVINLYYGGSLYEDIPRQYGQSLDHRGENKSLVYHDVDMSGSYLSEIIKQDQMMVTSLHHEAIKDLADGLRVEARSEDGIIEAILNPYYPYMLGVQWHPEISYDDNEFSKAIFRDFVKHSLDYKK